MTFKERIVDLRLPSVRDMSGQRRATVSLAALSLAVLMLAACSSSGGGSAASAPSSAGTMASTTPTGTASAQQSPVAAENAPPGDIADNVAFVRYANATGHYSFTHPEGWTQNEHGAAVLFTDKLNGVQVQTGTATRSTTVAGAKAQDVPTLKGTQAAFELRSVATASMPGGTGVLIVYRRNSAPDPVTGRQYRDEVQRYELVHAGHEVVVEMFGPVGADNVDAYRTMVQSLQIA
ncbi:MAG: lipoprotein [Frankiales bacterium]|nr:lipoprotein [Frankiales bacterium]